MRIKSYFVKSVDEALAQARAELGEDALLLSTRKSGDEYDVVFGSPGEGEAAPPAPRAARKAAGHGPGHLDEVRAQLDEIRRLLLAEQHAERLPEVARAFTNLIDSGMDNVLAGEIADRVQAAMAVTPKPKKLTIGWHARRFDWKKFESVLRSELSQQVRIDPSLEAVTALTGPGGAGKTLTVMKIAAFQAGPERPVRVFALGCELAARMQWQLFSRKTGVAFAPVESPEDLPAMIAQAREKEIVLIDMPGWPADPEKTAAGLAACSGIDTHLTVPGYMTANALRKCIERYSIFRPAKMLVTKLDESPAWGAAVCEAAQAGLRLSLFTNGVAIPKDLHAFSIDDLLSIALGGDRTQAACA